MNIMEKQTQKKKNFDFAGGQLKFKKQMKKSGNIKDDTDSDEEDVEDPKKPPPINNLVCNNCLHQYQIEIMMKKETMLMKMII